MKQFIAFILLLFPLFSFSKEESDSWKRIYLATYPRSGNRWMRSLIEEATHIATSCVYYPKLHTKVHPWGGYSTDHGYEGTARYPTLNDIVIIKTHFPALEATPFDLKERLLTIRIIRNPVDSFFSYNIYDGTNKIDEISDERLIDYITRWKKFHNYWNNQKSVVTLRYEDFISDPFINLQFMLDVIGHQVKDEDIIRAIQKYPPFGSELKHLIHFTKEQLIMIQNELGSFMEEFDYQIPL